MKINKKQYTLLNRAIIFNVPDLKHYRLSNTIPLIPKMTSAYVNKTSVTHPHPDDHTIQTKRDKIVLFTYISL